MRVINPLEESLGVWFDVCMHLPLCLDDTPKGVVELPVGRLCLHRGFAQLGKFLHPFGLIRSSACRSDGVLRHCRLRRLPLDRGRPSSTGKAEGTSFVLGRLDKTLFHYSRPCRGQSINVLG